MLILSLWTHFIVCPLRSFTLSTSSSLPLLSSLFWRSPPPPPPTTLPLHPSLPSAACNAIQGDEFTSSSRESSSPDLLLLICNTAALLQSTRTHARTHIDSHRAIDAHTCVNGKIYKIIIHITKKRTPKLPHALNVHFHSEKDLFFHTQ